MIKLFRDYISNKEKLSNVLLRMEHNADKFIGEGYSPTENPLSESIIDLLQSIQKVTCDVIEEYDTEELIESMLHIDTCVSNIYVKLGLPPCSFSKTVDRSSP